MTGSIPPPTSLSYEGQVAVPYITRTFDPLPSNNQFPISSIWINTATSKAFILVSKALGVAVWAHGGGVPGGIETITTPDTTVVVPTAHNINFLNGTGMNITGSGSDITFNVTGAFSDSFVTDSGTATPIAGVLHIEGTSAQGISTSGATNVVTITAADWTTTQKGVGVLSTDAESIAGSGTTEAVTPASLKAKLGTQTPHSLLVAEGTSSAITALGVAANGQIPIGSAGADPVLANITSTGGTITVTNGAGTINIEANAPSTVTAFLAQITATQVNVTGDNTFYLIVFDTIEQDTTSGAYSTSTGLFTAPKAGFYLLSACVLIGATNNSNTTGKFVFTINSTYQIDNVRGDYFAMSDAGGNMGVSISSIYYLNLHDTVEVDLQVAGGGKTISIFGTTAEAGADVSHFSCALL